MDPIVYIHGANATNHSFNFIAPNINAPAAYVSYDAHTPLRDIIAEAAEAIKAIGPCHVVAHSMGGIIALGALQHFPTPVHSLTTMSTPFGGVESASTISLMLPFNQFFQNIKPANQLLSTIRRQGSPVPMLNIVTNGGGSGLMNEANDGVVTVRSQRSILVGPSVEHVLVGLNHFEVLLSNDILTTINEFITTHTPQ